MRDRRTRGDWKDVLSLGLMLFLWFEYLRPGEYFPVLDRLKLTTIIPIAIFLIAAFSFQVRSLESVFRASSTSWFAYLGVLFVLQFVAADVTLYVYDKFKVLIGYLMIYFVIIRHARTETRVRFLMANFVVIHVALVGLHPDVLLDPGTRHYMAGTFLGDGNDFAWSTCIVLPYALYLARNTASKWNGLLFSACLLLLVLAVVGTQSRGGTLALAASTLYLAVRSRRKASVIAGLGLAVVAGLAFAPDAYFDRMSSISQYEEDGSAQGRILAWKSALRMAMDHPFTGVGPGHFAVMFGFQYKPSEYVGPYLNAHSIYFVMLGEFGFLGFIFLVGILVANAVRNERLIKSLSAASHGPGFERWRGLVVATQASFIAYAVAGAFLSGIYYPHLFIVAAVMEAVRYVVARERMKQGPSGLEARQPGSGRQADRCNLQVRPPRSVGGR